MKTRHATKVVALSSLAAAAVTAAWAITYAAGRYEWHPVYLWVISPYALCAVVLVLPWGMAWRRVLSGCTTALAMLLFTYLFYVEGLVRSTSSTSAIIVIFAPMYLVLGGAVLWVLTYVIVRKWIDVRTG